MAKRKRIHSPSVFVKLKDGRRKHVGKINKNLLPKPNVRYYFGKIKLYQMILTRYEQIIEFYPPSAPVKHITTRSRTHQRTSVFALLSNLLRLYRGPLLFSIALVS